MTIDLSRAETEALLENADARSEARAREVSPRDFAQPLRLSGAERVALGQRVRAALPNLERRLAAWLGTGSTLELDHIDEINARSIFDGLVEPFVVQFLEVQGQPGWILIPNEAAQALAEVAFGTPADDPLLEPRPLSPIEAGLTSDILLEIALGIAQTLGIGIEPGPLIQEPRALAASLPADLERDAQRVALYLDLKGAASSGASLRLYLPGILPSSPSRERGIRTAPPLPAHLSAVPVDLSARLGSIDVPLSDLLALEVGDVVPFGVGEGGPVTIFVEEQACGHAQWGSHRGGLALRILDFQPPDEE